MKLIKGTFIIATVVFFTSFGPLANKSTAQDKAGGWKILGQTTIEVGGQDRDELRINAKKGKLSQLKIQVKQAPLEMDKMVVHFKTNEKQNVWLRKNFEKGAYSKVVKVKGGKKEIKKVVFFYSKKDSGEKDPDEKGTKKQSAKNPVVVLWGKQ